MTSGFRIFIKLTTFLLLITFTTSSSLGYSDIPQTLFSARHSDTLRPGALEADPQIEARLRNALGLPNQTTERIPLVPARQIKSFGLSERSELRNQMVQKPGQSFTREGQLLNAKVRGLTEKRLGIILHLLIAVPILIVHFVFDFFGGLVRQVIRDRKTPKIQKAIKKIFHSARYRNFFEMVDRNGYLEIRELNRNYPMLYRIYFNSAGDIKILLFHGKEILGSDAKP
ncbi:MAG: hypothetical protein HY582_04810 [Candidatus Omnitrophica bacterium]|nr:hypothetical protein [Candidatus Omnitrophota bacterium]